MIPSERPGYAILECYNQLKDHVEFITAFDFPCAVAFWNSASTVKRSNGTVFRRHREHHLWLG